MRLYDPSNGVILINGHDIKSLKLEHLRRAVAVLFQDYTHFPLSVSLWPPLHSLVADYTTPFVAL